MKKTTPLSFPKTC